MSHKIKKAAVYILLVIISAVMLYPLLWLVGATFKDNNEIFAGIDFLPVNPTLSGYLSAFESYGGNVTLLHSMLNTYKYVIPKVIFTLVSSLLTAYGFSRFRFRGRKLLFAVLIASMFLPQIVLNVPQYVLFSQLGWVDSPLYAPLTVPSLFAVDAYFVFLLIQFFRTVPRELDDAAKIDGCGSFGTLVHVLLPMLTPALTACAIFQFLWSSNDYLSPLLYVSTPENYPVSIFAKLSMDADSGFAWNRVLAVSLISAVPSFIVFFAAQKFFVEGISAGALKE